jgi:putative phosphonate catabolism associated alcohol dehydrogenase
LKYGHQRFDGPSDLRGGLATHVLLAPRTDIFRVPADLPDAVACPAGCATATVAAALRHAGDLADATVLVLGAGLLGLTSAAMARARGARAVIVTDPDPVRLRRADRFRATHTAVGSDELAGVLHSATGGYGVDVALELSGNVEAAEEALARLRIGGRCLWIGSVFPSRPVALTPETFVRRHLSLQGVHNYHPRDLATALTFLSTHHRSIPFVELASPPLRLAEVDEAFRLVGKSGAVRMLITP